MENDHKIYFISDIHLGLPNFEKSLEREKLLVKFLDEIKNDSQKIFFVGDIFDFWWEYNSVVPRGYVRFLGKIAELADSGIEMHFFTGNHDLWMKNYFAKEMNVIIHHKEQKINLGNKSFFIAHGDGLGQGDKSYKMLKKIFSNKFLQYCFSLLHPDLAFFIARKWSQSRRKKEKFYDFKGIENEIILKFAREHEKYNHFDYYIFGHRHFPLKYPLSPESTFINLGDWIVNFTFAVFSNNKIEIKTFKNAKQETFETSTNAKYFLDIF